MPDWLRRLLVFLRCDAGIPKDFVGQVEVNIFKGGVSNVNVRQSYKEGDTDK